jgi:hypothetical protein
MSTEELLAQVLRLAREDRAMIAAAVLASLEKPAEAKVWARELEHRSREIAERQVRPAGWETAHQREILQWVGKVDYDDAYEPKQLRDRNPR